MDSLSIYDLRYAPASSALSYRNDGVRCDADDWRRNDASTASADSYGRIKYPFSPRGVLGLARKAKQLGLRSSLRFRSAQRKNEKPASSSNDLRIIEWVNSRRIGARSSLRKSQMCESESSGGSDSWREYTAGTSGPCMGTEANMQTWSQSGSTPIRSMALSRMQSQQRAEAQTTQRGTRRRRHGLPSKVSNSLSQRSQVHAKEHLSSSGRLAGLSSLPSRYREKAAA